MPDGVYYAGINHIHGGFFITERASAARNGKLTHKLYLSILSDPYQRWSES